MFRLPKQSFLMVLFTVVIVLSLAWTSTTTYAQPAQANSAAPAAPTTLGNTPALTAAMASSAPVRIIVQLDDPAVAQYSGGISGYSAPAKDAGGKLAFQAAATVSYQNYLLQQQKVFTLSLAKTVPSATVEYQYQLAYNGVALKVPGTAIAAIEAMPGVRSVSLALRHEPTMDASLQLIGLYNGLIDSGADTGMWSQIGGHALAGQGIKIADIDTGIDQTVSFFNPAGYSYPAGFPVGDTAYTTPKVIAARVYIRPDSPADTTVDCNCPQDHIGHGSHTAGTMAGDYGTDTGYGSVGSLIKISGVAPKAYLMNYKIFYTNAVDAGQYSETPEELMAIEDVIRDGADVVNNSWGGTALDVADPSIDAFNAAIDAGIVVVFSAGNSGPSVNTIGNPGNGARFITVGASTTNRLFYHDVSVPGGDATVTGLLGAISSGPAFTTDIGPLPYVDSKAVDSTNEIGCKAFPAGAFANSIALIKRGTCNFSAKIGFAVDAGAKAVIVWNSVAGLPISMGSLATTNTVPSVMVSNAGGLSLRAWLTANPGAMVTIGGALSRITNNAWQDTVASFSSKGPGLKNIIKPDLVAPGVNILSSVNGGGFELYQGTSMAAPHVTGVAALVRQLHPTWTPAQVKSAIVNTTVLPTTLDPSCLDIINAPAPGPQCRGAGRLNAGYPAGPGDPGLTFDTPTVSLGAKFPGSDAPVTIHATNVGPAGDYTVTVDQTVTDAAVTITAPPAAITFAAGETKDIGLDFNIGAAAAAKDYYGMIHVNGTDSVHKLSIPYWFRVLPAFTMTPGAQVLLIDDDSSNAGVGFADYRSYYTAALDSLGIKYDVFETDTATTGTCASPWDIAAKYPMAIQFTGDSRGYLYYCDFGILSPNISGMNNYLAAGGRLLVTGKSFANGLAVGDGRAADLKLIFGTDYLANNVYGSGNTPGSPSAVGIATSAPVLGGIKIDFNPAVTGAGAGAGNQTVVRELSPMNYFDINDTQLVQAVSGYATVGGVIGTAVSSQPSIERVKNDPRTLWTTLSARTILLNFGVEGVNDNATGTVKRADILSMAVRWLTDEVGVTASVVNTTIKVGDTVKMTATGTSNLVGDKMAFYRWDWGDGNTPNATAPDVVTGAGSAYHLYEKAGTYQAYVEVVDVNGHAAVTKLTITVNNPLPTLTTLNPLSVIFGGPTFTLSVTGTNFVSGAVVKWNGSPCATTYVSDGQLTATITAANIAAAGTFPVTVTNPAPGGGTSNAVNFTVKSLKVFLPVIGH